MKKKTDGRYHKYENQKDQVPKDQKNTPLIKILCSVGHIHTPTIKSLSLECDTVNGKFSYNNQDNDHLENDLEPPFSLM